MTSRRNTIQKDLVRNAVYEMRRHVTANEVYEFIKEAYPTIGKGTVYRNLSNVAKIPDCLRQWNFGLYVSGFWHIHAKTPRRIVVCEQ